MAVGHWNGERWQSDGWWTAKAGQTVAACHSPRYTMGNFWVLFDPPR